MTDHFINYDDAKIPTSQRKKQQRLFLKILYVQNARNNLSNSMYSINMCMNEIITNLVPILNVCMSSAANKTEFLYCFIRYLMF